MKNKKNLIKILVSLLLIGYLILKIDWKSFYVTLIGIKIWFVVFGGLLFFTGILFSVLRWKILLKYFGIHVKKKEPYRLYFESSFYSNFLPTSFGGDVYKYFALLNKNKDKKKEIIASMILERGSGFGMLFILNIFLMPIFSKIIWSNKPLMFTEIILTALTLLITFIFFFRNSILRFLRRRNKRKFIILTKIMEFLETLNSVTNFSIFISLSLYSLLFVINIIIGQFFYFSAFGIYINPLYILFSVTIIQIVGVLPISLNSIGISEGLTVYLYSLIGVSPEIALAIALISRICLLISSAIGMIPTFFSNNNDEVTY